MRIAILTELFPPSIGGQEVRYAEIAKVLTDRGHSVHVYCIQSMPETKQEEIVDNTVVHRYPAAYEYRQPLLKMLRRSPWSVLRFAMRCRKIDPSAFDCFIFNQWPIAHILLAPNAIRSKSVIDWCEFRNGAMFALLQKYLLRLPAINITNNIALKQAFEAYSDRNFEVLPSGIFSARYQSLPAAKRSGVLYVGRIEEHKNLQFMLSAFDVLRSKGYSGRLRIAGSGPELSHLRRLVKSSQADEAVDILGFISEQQKVELLASSEAFLLTSRREGFPRVVAEAMASGLPVVTVDYPENGARDIVRQYEIGLVTDPDPAKVAEGILAVMARWQTYSDTCISASRTLDWDILVDKLLQIASAQQANRA